MEYHAAYYLDKESGWYTVQVLDFPGAVSQGRTLRSARRMIRDAVRELTAYLVEEGKPLPIPNSKATDASAELVEPIRVSFRVHAGATR
jgi:predicted RNase H-like HicB family nuclease